TARNAATRTLMTIPALRTFDEQSVPLWPVRTVSVEMTLMTMLPADVETLMPRQTGAVPENHRAATTGSMAYMAITTSSIAHVRLTVTDIELSRQFYESVFGWPVLIEAPESADAATPEAPCARAGEPLSCLFGGVIYDLGGTLIGLRPVASDSFHEDRCGLDHLA